MCFHGGVEKGEPCPAFFPSWFTFRDHLEHQLPTAPGTAGEQGLCSTRHSDSEVLQGILLPWAQLGPHCW